MANVITYNQVIELLIDITKRHKMVNTFYLGRNWELENSEDIMYPLFQVYPDFGKLPITPNGDYRTQQIRFVCKMIDLVLPGESNERDVDSDTLRYCQDIINEFNQHPFYMRSNIKLIGDIDFNKLDEFEDDVTAGWEFNLTFQLMNMNQFCGMPLEDIPGYSATGPQSTGTIVNVQFLTCETLPDCPVIEQIEETLVDLQEQIDNIPPSNNTLAQTLGYGNSTNNLNITAGTNFSNILQVSDTVMGLSWNDVVGGNVTLDNTIATIYHDLLTQVESQVLINILAPTIISTGETTFNSLNVKGKVDIFDTGINLTFQDTALANLYLDNSISLLYHDALVQLESTGNINILGSSITSMVHIDTAVTKVTSNQIILTSTDNASVNIVSPAGFFYPSLNFFNQGTNLLGQISAYAGQLYLSGVGGTPLVVGGTFVQFPLETADTLAYFDVNSRLHSVTLGAGLTLVGGTLSASTPSLSGTAPIVYTAGVISITQATTSTNGYLSSIDWNIFNNKQNALGFTPENVANKATTFVTLNNTLYPTTQAVANYVTAFGYITSSALTPYLTSATAASTYVPYTGATTDLDMGTHMASADTLRVTGTAGTGYLRLPNQSVTPSAPTISLRMFADSLNRLSWIGLNGYTRTFDGTSNTANRIYVLPDNSGTVALISDLTTGYVPYTGATTNVNLGSNNFTVTGSITTGMSGSASRVVEAGSGGALTATKDIIDGFLLAGSAPAILLTNVANWTAKVYTGTAITGTYQGQQFFDNNYYFVAVNDNDWIRTARA